MVSWVLFTNICKIVTLLDLLFSNLDFTQEYSTICAAQLSQQKLYLKTIYRFHINRLISHTYTQMETEIDMQTDQTYTTKQNTQIIFYL